MNFILFFIFYLISTLILTLILFICYKTFFKKIIISKLAENTMLSAFDSLDQKSILDINIPIEKKEEKKEDEKVYTYF